MGQCVCVLSVGTSIEDITAWYCIPRTNHRPFILYASFMWHYSYYLFYWGGNIIQRHVYCVYIHYNIEDTSARQSLARSPYLQTREIITKKPHTVTGLDIFLYHWWLIYDDCIIELSKSNYYNEITWTECVCGLCLPHWWRTNIDLIYIDHSVWKTSPGSPGHDLTFPLCQQNILIWLCLWRSRINADTWSLWMLTHGQYEILFPSHCHLILWKLN